MNHSKTTTLPVDYPQQLEIAKTLQGEQMIEYADALFGPRLGILCSFGTEALVGVHMAIQVVPKIPVLAVDPGQLPLATLKYRDDCARRYDLNLHIIRPDLDEVRREDPNGKLYKEAQEDCCNLRKVRPLNRAVQSWNELIAQYNGSLERNLGNRYALLTGIKKHHGDGRENAQSIVTVGNRTDFAPLFHYTREQIAAEFIARGLPRHPLEGKGYKSIGCGPCSSPNPDSEGFRDGRWVGSKKRACLINLADRQTALTPNPTG
jgi:phosphoadenylyl-sulfate reductase (thioredoxin)